MFPGKNNINTNAYRVIKPRNKMNYEKVKPDNINALLMQKS